MGTFKSERMLYGDPKYIPDRCNEVYNLYVKEGIEIYFGLRKALLPRRRRSKDKLKEQYELLFFCAQAKIWACEAKKWSAEADF